MIDYTNQEIPGEDGRAANLIDGNISTYWHFRWTSNPITYPYYVTVDMKTNKPVSVFALTQRKGSRHIRKIEIQVSYDNKQWSS